MLKKLLECFMKENGKRQIKTEFRVEKLIKKCDKIGRKVMVVFLIVGLMKKILLDKTSYYSEQDRHSRNKGKVELPLSNYATKSEVKKVIGKNTSDSAQSFDLVSVKSEVDTFDINKIKSV